MKKKLLLVLLVILTLSVAGGVVLYIQITKKDSYIPNKYESFYLGHAELHLNPDLNVIDSKIDINKFGKSVKLVYYDGVTTAYSLEDCDYSSLTCDFLFQFFDDVDANRIRILEFDPYFARLEINEDSFKNEVYGEFDRTYVLADRTFVKDDDSEERDYLGCMFFTSRKADQSMKIYIR